MEARGSCNKWWGPALRGEEPVYGAKAPCVRRAPRQVREHGVVTGTLNYLKYRQRRCRWLDSITEWVLRYGTESGAVKAHFSPHVATW